MRMLISRRTHFGSCLCAHHTAQVCGLLPRQQNCKIFILNCARLFACCTRRNAHITRVLHAPTFVHVTSTIFFTHSAVGKHGQPSWPEFCMRRLWFTSIFYTYSVVGILGANDRRCLFAYFICGGMRFRCAKANDDSGCVCNIVECLWVGNMPSTFAAQARAQKRRLRSSARATCGRRRHCVNTVNTV